MLRKALLLLLLHPPTHVNKLTQHHSHLAIQALRAASSDRLRALHIRGIKYPCPNATSHPLVARPWNALLAKHAF